MVRILLAVLTLGLSEIVRVLLPHRPTGPAIAVRTYKTRRAMEAGLNEMAAKGYEVAQQSGEFAANLWTTSMLNRPKVTVTFRLTA